MISLSICTTAVPSMWSRHIAISFLRTCKGCRHAPRMLIMDRHFLYNFFLILEFLLWASCPWHNHCCLTQVSHGEQNKRRIPVCHHPVQWPRFLDLNGSHQHQQLHFWHWHNYHPSFQSLAQHSLQWYRMWRNMAWQNCSWQEMSRRNSGKEEKFHEHNPIHVLQYFFYCCFLLTVKPKQSQSQSIHFPGTASCKHICSGGKRISCSGM